jgi:hypothetical protein
MLVRAVCKTTTKKHFKEKFQKYDKSSFHQGATSCETETKHGMSEDLGDAVMSAKFGLHQFGVLDSRGGQLGFSHRKTPHITLHYTTVHARDVSYGLHVSTSKCTPSQKRDLYTFAHNLAKY